MSHFMNQHDQKPVAPESALSPAQFAEIKALLQPIHDLAVMQLEMLKAAAPQPAAIESGSGETLIDP